MVETEFSEDRARLIDLVHGYRATCMIATAIEIGLVDALRVGPLREERLAERLGAHLPSLRRFLRALAVLGLTERQEEGVGLTSMGRLLIDVDAGVRERAILAGAEYLPAWQALRHSVTTGEAAHDHVFGMSAWERRQLLPELGACLNRTMADDQVRSGHALSSAVDFSRFRLVVDVGGGQGALLAEILAQWPQPAGLVFDQPHVVAGAAGVLAAAGVQHRCRVAGGSFFDAVPAGGDAYLLQHVLHNWNDERSAVILANCRAAMSPGAVLLVVENLLPADGDPSPHLALLDLHMLVMLGGRERTRDEYRTLLQSAGFELKRTVGTRTRVEVLEAVPA
jgi:hypothetical protein